MKKKLIKLISTKARRRYLQSFVYFDWINECLLHYGMCLEYKAFGVFWVKVSEYVIHIKERE